MYTREHARPQTCHLAHDHRPSMTPNDFDRRNMAVLWRRHNRSSGPPGKSVAEGGMQLTVDFSTFWHRTRTESIVCNFVDVAERGQSGCRRRLEIGRAPPWRPSRIAGRPNGIWSCAAVSGSWHHYCSAMSLSSTTSNSMHSYRGRLDTSPATDPFLIIAQSSDISSGGRDAWRADVT